MPTIVPVFNFPADAEAVLSFVATEVGGRTEPVQSGYRPQFFYSGHDWDAVHEYPDSEFVYPGETARVLLRFLSPQEHVGRVAAGLEFEVREGSRVVAKGRITKLLGLEQSAARAAGAH